MKIQELGMNHMSILAITVLIVVWLFLVTPMLGSGFTTFGSYREDFIVGLKVQGVLAVLAGAIYAVLWALETLQVQGLL